MKILSVSDDAKTVKGEPFGWLTGVVYLAPHKLAGGPNICPFASPQCIELCLNTSGRGQFNAVQQSRIAKTRFFHNHKRDFLQQLLGELTVFEVTARRRNLRPCVRLNGTSDIKWESIPVFDGKSIIELFPRVQFYDYTKSPVRMERQQKGDGWLSNYYLTFSRSEHNEATVRKVMASGGNVSVVFNATPPARWNGFAVIDGDQNDLRFLDPRGVIVGLKAKGSARKATEGFVVHT